MEYGEEDDMCEDTWGQQYWIRYNDEYTRYLYSLAITIYEFNLENHPEMDVRDTWGDAISKAEKQMMKF